MSGKLEQAPRPAVASPVADRRAARRDATRAEIIEAAWALAREQGLSGWTMRDLGGRTGMRAQSLYEYYAGKHEIYDAMFESGYRAFLAHMRDERRVPGSAEGRRAVARDAARRFFTFCVSDPTRFQLLFLRTIPGFEPSAERYALAVEALDDMRRQSAAMGIAEDRMDLWTAVMTGLASQQIANDPGGDRWASQVDDAVDMLLAHTAVRGGRQSRTDGGAG